MMRDNKKKSMNNPRLTINQNQQGMLLCETKREEDQNLKCLIPAQIAYHIFKEENLDSEKIMLLSKQNKAEKSINNYKRQIFEIFKSYTFMATYRFIQNKMQTSSKNKKYKKSSLLSLFLKIKDNPLETFLSVQLYQSAVGELGSMISNQILDLYNHLSKEESEDYATIAKTGKDMADRTKTQEFSQLKFTILDMFKIDILSVFLLYQYKYRQLPEESRVYLLFRYQFLERVFGIGVEMLKIMKQRHNENAGIFVYKYEQDFDEFITLYSIIRFKSAISSHLRWISKEKEPNRSNQWKQIPFYGLMPTYSGTKKILYKFSQIVFVRPKFQTIQMQCQKTKDLIVQHIQQRCNGRSVDVIKKNIIEIAILFKISLKSVHQWQVREQSVFDASMEKDKFGGKIEAFKWLGFQAFQGNSEVKNKPIVKLNILSYKQKVSPIIKNIIKMARNRFRQLCQIKKDIAFLHKYKPKKRVVTICKFQYSYVRFKKIKKPQRQQKQLVCTLIIAIQKQKILLTTLINKAVSQDQFSSILIQSFKKEGAENFTILLNDFNFQFSSGNYLRLKEKLKEELNVKVHIVHNAFLFIAQSGFNEVLSKCLEIYSQELSQNNFYLAIRYFKMAIQSIFQTYFHDSQAAEPTQQK